MRSFLLPEAHQGEHLHMIKVRCVSDGAILTYFYSIQLSCRHIEDNPIILSFDLMSIMSITSDLLRVLERSSQDLPLWEVSIGKRSL